MADPHAAHDAHGHGDRHPRLQHHFQDMRTQQHAARLGMWLFLATEILLFGGLFCAYSLLPHALPRGVEGVLAST